MARASRSSGVASRASARPHAGDLALGHLAEHRLDQLVLGGEVVVDQRRC